MVNRWKLRFSWPWTIIAFAVVLGIAYLVSNAGGDAMVVMGVGGGIILLVAFAILIKRIVDLFRK